MIAAMPFLIVHIAIYLLPKFGAFVSFVTIKPLSHPTSRKRITKTEALNDEVTYKKWNIKALQRIMIHQKDIVCIVSLR